MNPPARYRRVSHKAEALRNDSVTAQRRIGSWLFLLNVPHRMFGSTVILEHSVGGERLDMTCEHGDWMIRDHQGVFSPATDERFREMFEGPVDSLGLIPAKDFPSRSHVRDADSAADLAVRDLAQDGNTWLNEGVPSC